MIYFTKQGKVNTKDTVKAVLTRAEELKIKQVVVASNTGATAEKFACRDFEVTCVTHHVGFTGPGEDEMATEARQKLGRLGIKILTTTHLLSGVDRALRNKFEGIYPAEIIASTLRMFGQGLKVCVEISVMALDAGLIPYGEEIITVGGTGRGADTAAVIVPAHSIKFFDTKIKEIICMPR
jgi:uncharacterized protein